MRKVVRTIKIQLQNKGKNTGYFEVKAQGDTRAELTIYGEITSDKWWEEDVTPTEIKELLDSVKDKDLDIYINSPGGSVFAGLSIYHMLKRHNGKKIVHVDGVAASIASIIAMAGDEIHIPVSAYLMIHRAWTYTAGNRNDLLETINLLEKMDSNMADIYKTKALEEISNEKIIELMDDETWLSGKEAQQYFNIITEDIGSVSACLDGLKLSDKMPESLKNRLKSVEKTGDKEEETKIELEKAKLKLKIKMGGII